MYASLTDPGAWMFLVIALVLINLVSKFASKE